jgi:hypothetical protein
MIKFSPFVVAALAVVACRSSAPATDGGRPIEPMTIGSYGSDEAIDLPTAVTPIAAAIIIPDTSASSRPRNPQPVQDSAGVLCCAESACVVPGPADCRHRYRWCDSYTIDEHADLGIRVAHCASFSSTETPSK